MKSFSNKLIIKNIKHVLVEWGKVGATAYFAFCFIIMDFLSFIALPFRCSAAKFLPSYPPCLP